MRGSSVKLCHTLGKWMIDCCKSVKSEIGARSFSGQGGVVGVGSRLVLGGVTAGGWNTLRGTQVRYLRYMTFPPRHQPWESWSSVRRRWLNLNDSNVVWALIAANGAVFLLWRIDPYFASKHFVVSLESLRSGRIWTALTASFSQQDFGHLASNMISLYFFGSDVGRMFGGHKVSSLAVNNK